MENTYVELIEKLSEKKIIAFGCGNFFKKALLRYPKLIEKVAFILDNQKKDMYIYEKRKIPVYKPEVLLDKCLDEYIIIFFANKWKEMKKQLDELLVKEYEYFYFPFEVNYMIDKEMSYYHRVAVPVIEELEKAGMLRTVLDSYGLDSSKQLAEAMVNEKISAIPRIPIILTPKCSLRCKECNNLMWKFTTYQDLATDIIKKSLKKIISAFDFIPSVELIGGEPFTAKNLKEILDFLIKEEKVLRVEITTNASVLPQQEWINSLQDEKVIVRISDYSMIVNQERFAKCMEDNHIHYEKLSFENWIATGGIEKRNRESAELIKQYYNCDAGYLCKTLWENKVYPCARAASLAELGIYKECPYVDVSKSEKLKERLTHFFMVPTCGPCDYCNVAVEDIEFVEPAVQIQK